MADLRLLFSLCSSASPGGWLAGTNLLGMATLGLAGSVLHCGPMCGPLVMGQAASRMACLSCNRMSEAGRLRSALMPRYHLGRIFTYAALGLVAGSVGFGVVAWLRPLRVVLLLAAAAALLLTAWGRAGAGAPAGTARFATGVLRRATPGGFTFGLTLGLLPCGLVYTALLGAAASASPLWGAACMAAFGAGTVPMLAAAALAGKALQIGRFAPALLSINAAIIVGSLFF
jgi:sulfite exporter TauE/SafE